MNGRNDRPISRPGGTRTARFVQARDCEPYDGVGRALAKSFPAADQQDLPQDMMQILMSLGLSGSVTDDKHKESNHQ